MENKDNPRFYLNGKLMLCIATRLQLSVTNNLYEYFKAHFPFLNGPGNNIHPETGLTEIIVLHAYLPGKHPLSSGFLCFVSFNHCELNRDQQVFKLSLVFSHFSQRKISKMNSIQYVNLLVQFIVRICLSGIEEHQQFSNST